MFLPVDLISASLPFLYAGDVLKLAYTSMDMHALCMESLVHRHTQTLHAYQAYPAYMSVCAWLERCNASSIVHIFSKADRLGNNVCAVMAALEYIRSSKPAPRAVPAKALACLKLALNDSPAPPVYAFRLVLEAIAYFALDSSNRIQMGKAISCAVRGVQLGTQCTDPELIKAACKALVIMMRPIGADDGSIFLQWMHYAPHRHMVSCFNFGELAESLWKSNFDSNVIAHSMWMCINIAVFTAGKRQFRGRAKHLLGAMNRHMTSVNVQRRALMLMANLLPFMKDEMVSNGAVEVVESVANCHPNFSGICTKIIQKCRPS